MGIRVIIERRTIPRNELLLSDPADETPRQRLCLPRLHIRETLRRSLEDSNMYIVISHLEFGWRSGRPGADNKERKEIPGQDRPLRNRLPAMHRVYAYY